MSKRVSRRRERRSIELASLELTELLLVTARPAGFHPSMGLPVVRLAVHALESRRWTVGVDPGYVKRLLPLRQSRGNSYFGLVACACRRDLVACPT